jgi:DNA-binding NtrC family response regulator
VRDEIKTMNRASQSLIAVADDDPDFCAAMEHRLRQWSYRVVCAHDKTELLQTLSRECPDFLLLDVRFGEHDGVEILGQLRVRYPDLKVLVLTAFGTIDNAIAAIRLGAVDYLTKPVDLNRLRRVIGVSLGSPGLPKPCAPSAASPVSDMLSRPLLGESPPMRAVRALVERVARTDATVLILGESGTGKELVARAVHELSPRRRGPFVPLNVAAVPRDLVESTLFGHAKGAFTGADRAQTGCCEAAHGGTLFLDEIAEMEIGLQAKLLRFLQEHAFQRVGQSLPVSVDVRVVAATNRDPLVQIRRGQLREDLYYRLNVVPITLPPLRERREDIPLLAKHFFTRSSAQCGRPGVSCDAGALAEMMQYPWHGNVRELENVCMRMAILSAEPVVTAAEVRAELRNAEQFDPSRTTFDDRVAQKGAGGAAALTEHMRPIDRLEYDAIVKALERSGGNVREAANSLGLGHATIYRKLKKYGIS